MYQILPERVEFSARCDKTCRCVFPVHSVGLFNVHDEIISSNFSAMFGVREFRDNYNNLATKWRKSFIIRSTVLKRLTRVTIGQTEFRSTDSAFSSSCGKIPFELSKSNRDWPGGSFATGRKQVPQPPRDRWYVRASTKKDIKHPKSLAGWNDPRSSFQHRF